MGEGRQGGGRTRLSEPQGLARGRGRRAGLGDRRRQGRSLSHQGEGFLQVRRQRLTFRADTIRLRLRCSEVSLLMLANGKTTIERRGGADFSGAGAIKRWKQDSHPSAIKPG